MKDALQVFSYAGKQVRVTEIAGAPYFVGKDVAEVLGYENPTKAIRDHVYEEDRLMGVQNVTPSVEDSMGRLQYPTWISESGVYSLIMRSQLPTARQFTHWVTSEVLPSIRKHGAYITPATMERVISDPDFGIRLLEALKAERNKVASLETTVAIQAQQIAEAQPKITYYDKVLRSPSLVKTSIIAKDYGYSAQSFNKLLARLKIQYKQGDIWLLYQRYADKGYTQTETYTYINEKTGEPGTQCWTKWTQKGRLFLYDTLKGHGYLPACEKEGAA
ncbi:MAG: phage antirepressor [Clostridia bacterium]|nr:phage antirepressor [Clostridia bacterium]